MTTPRAPRHDGFRLGRLWSLWDMYEIHIKPFLDMQDMLVQWSIVSRANTTNRARLSLPGNRENFAKHLRNLIAEMQSAEFDMCRRAVERFLGHLEGDAPAEQLLHDAEDLRGRLLDQVESIRFLALSLDEVAYFDSPKPLFGPRMEQHFPSVIYEIEESAKCLALDRSTASAFHSIRCLEAGIRALSRSMGIPDPTKAHERSWKKLLDRLKMAIDERWPTSSNRMEGDGYFFDITYAALAAMQNPYRNATMHLDQKYTQDEARHIFDVVKGIMTRIASRMDENGEPKAL